MSKSKDQRDTPTKDLLAAWKQGDARAFDDILPRLESELRRLARIHLKRERPGNSLQASDLIQEVFLRLDRQSEISDRGHFMVLASRMMRQVLVDHARARKAIKRGREVQKVVLDEARDEPDREAIDLDRVLTIDSALIRYAELDPRRARVVELRYFGGLTIEEIARALEISPATVKLDLRLARMWLAEVIQS